MIILGSGTVKKATYHGHKTPGYESKEGVIYFLLYLILQT